MGRKKKYRIRMDHKGEFIYRHHFIRGKQKLTKVYLVNGIPSDEIDQRQFYLDNADLITLLQDGEYELIQELEMEASLDDDLADEEKLPF